MNELLVLLLPLAAFSGWWLARTDKIQDKDQKADDYFKGLGCNLFRVRGEVDRALHIHANLANKSTLAPSTLQKLNLALADDYLAAGIMNHAEAFFTKTCQGGDPAMRETAHRRLISLFAEQSQWQKAIDVGEDLDPLKRDAVQQHIAHFHCEIAKQALDIGDFEAATESLQQALLCDKRCVRATLKLGRLAASQKNYVSAISYFNRLENQNPPVVMPHSTNRTSGKANSNAWQIPTTIPC